MLQEDNMKELRCSLPNDRFRLVGGNGTGQLVGEEPVDLRLAFKKGDLHGRVPFSLEIQEVGTHARKSRGRHERLGWSRARRARLRFST